MNIQELAAVLNGREYGEEITKEETQNAKAAELVVVYGYSDDNVEFAGAIQDEIGAYEGATLHVDAKGVLGEHEDCECQYCGYDDRKKTARRIDAVWGEKGTEYAWSFKTDITHATFEIVEDGKPFCRGIVFAIESLK